MNSQQIVAVLPYLRRYARALTGSQDRGDQYVRVCLEAVLKEPERIKSHEDVRLQLFTLFHDVWAMVDSIAPQPERSHPDGETAQVEQSVVTLPPLERQVLLLVFLERFPIADVARILDLGEHEVLVLLDRAKADIRCQSAVDVLIIEDDPVIAMNLSLIVEDMGHSVVGTAARHDEAVKLALEYRPGLVLADVRLADGDDGIETVQDILEGMEARVIFITGHPERLLTGQTVEPAFVLTKPFEPDVLRAAIGQALTMRMPHDRRPSTRPN